MRAGSNFNPSSSTAVAPDDYKIPANHDNMSLGLYVI